jgi:hypothetical protein
VVVPATQQDEIDRQVCALVIAGADLVASDHLGEVLLEAPDVVLYERKFQCKECSPLGVALKQADGRLVPLASGWPLQKLGCAREPDPLLSATVECPGEGAAIMLGIRHSTNDPGSTEPGLAFELLAVGPPAADAQ